MNLTHDTLTKLVAELGANIDLLKKGRTYDKLRTRWQVWREAHKRGFTFASIGRATGYNHATVMYAVKKEGPSSHDLLGTSTTKSTDSVG